MNQFFINYKNDIYNLTPRDFTNKILKCCVCGEYFKGHEKVITMTELTGKTEHYVCPHCQNTHVHRMRYVPYVYYDKKTKRTYVEFRWGNYPKKQKKTGDA